MTSDPFEEFEFRPLTEGLGFHRQNEKKATPASSPTFELKQRLPEIEMPVTTRAPEAKRLPTEAPKTTEAQGGTVDEILKTLQSKRKPEFSENRVSTAPAATAYRDSGPDVSSFILDGMLIMAASLGCLIILLMVTRVDLFATLTQTSDTMTYAALAVLFAGVAWIYLVLNRIFLGYTPGEWVFDHRIGWPQSLGRAEFSLRVLVRATLVIATGFLPLPILSLMLGKDIAGLISGAPLMKKV